MNKKFVYVILSIMCFLLTIGIYIQIKTVESSKAFVAKTNIEAELRDNILRFQDKYNDSYNILEEENNKLDNLIKELAKKDETEIDYPSELKRLNALLGYYDVEGQGIVITVQDGDTKTSYGDNWVHDGDLYKIVNMLKSGGAEAISINDERIVNNTAITCAGNIVMINGKKIGSPFVIEAIGLTEKLYGTVTVTDSYLKLMEEDGVKVDIEKKDKIKIKKYNGVYSFNYAKNLE